jgi:hypothetical protein
MALPDLQPETGVAEYLFRALPPCRGCLTLERHRGKESFCPRPAATRRAPLVGRGGRTLQDRPPTPGRLRPPKDRSSRSAQAVPSGQGPARPGPRPRPRAGAHSPGSSSAGHSRGYRGSHGKLWAWGWTASARDAGRRGLGPPARHDGPNRGGPCPRLPRRGSHPAWWLICDGVPGVPVSRPDA